MTDVTPTELEQAIALIRSGKAPIQLKAGDILAACKLGIVGPREAHHLLGLSSPADESTPGKSRLPGWLQRMLYP